MSKAASFHIVPQIGFHYPEMKDNDYPFPTSSLNLSDRFANFSQSVKRRLQFADEQNSQELLTLWERGLRLLAALKYANFTTTGLGVYETNLWLPTLQPKFYQRGYQSVYQ